MRLIAVCLAAAALSCSAAPEEPTPAPLVYACTPPPELNGKQWLACNVNPVSHVPCCVYDVDDCAVIACRMGGCTQSWARVEEKCDAFDSTDKDEDGCAGSKCTL